MTHLALKIQLHQHCIALLEERIRNAETAMLLAQESANSEDKSSAGDKYETGRAMSQIARDMNAKQLKTAVGDLKELQKYDPSKELTTVVKGALVFTEDGPLIYISTGIGMIRFGEHQVAVVSAQSPLALQLLHKKTGDAVSIQQRAVRISAIV